MFFNINLTFNQQNYSIPISVGQFKKLMKNIPDSIAEQMLNHQNIIVNSAVKTENFLQFVRYLSESLEPKINSDNAYDFFLLNQEFQILTDYLSDKIDTDILNISALCSNDNNDKSQNEKYIAMHLDECIEKYEQELLKIPLNSLVNIFFHKERILNDHQKAYDFIIKESFSNIYLYILLQSIDGEKLNIQSQFESFSKINERRGYLPIFNQNFLEPIMKKCEKLSEIEKENQMLKEEINKITNQNNSIEDIESFILSINDKIKPEKGKTIIHWACENNRPDIVEYAISKKTIDINSVWTSLQSSGKVKKVDDSYEKTALNLAIENNNIDIVKILLSSPEIDVNAYYKRENSSLIIGVMYESEEYEKTALHLAIENNNIDIVKALVSSPKFDCNAYYKIDRYRLIIAVSPCIQFSRKYEKTALHLAIENNNIDIVKFLLSLLSIDVNAYYKSEDCNKTALHLAIENNNIDIIKMLLPHPKVDVNAYYKSKDCDKTALHLAIEDNNIDIIKMLLSYSKIDVNAYYKSKDCDKTALHLAIEDNNIDIIKMLLSYSKIDVNAYYKSKNYELGMDCHTSVIDYEKTALHLAIENNDIEIVKVLLTSPEIDVNAYYKHKDSKKSTTALHIAVENKYIEIIVCLLESKHIDVNKKDGQGRKPIEITNDPKIKSLF